MKIIRNGVWGIGSAIIIALLMLAPAGFAHAATLSVSSASANVTTGDVVTVRILVSSSNQAINTAEGTLQFPPDILQALSIDKSSSIFTIWVEDPSFSNSTGEVDFSGGLPTPGYQGSGGTVLKATFITKKPGTATLSLSGASVRANDGMGTDVLTSATGLTLTVTSPATAPPVVTTPVTAPATSPSTATATASQPSSATASDTIPPTITSSKFTYDPTTGMLSVTAKAHDTGSGIANYSVSIDNASTTTISPADFASGPYQIPVHESGSHTALLTVTDKEGNKTGVTGSFDVPVVPPPSLNALPSTMDSGSQLSVQGTAPSQDVKVYLYIEKNGAAPSEFSATPDATGSFILLGPIVQKGSYDVWAVGVSSGGVLSAPSPKMHIAVKDGTVLSVGPFNFTLANILLIFLLFSIASFLAAVLGWYKAYTYYRERKHVVAKVKKDIHHALGVFKDDMTAHLDALESADTRRKLTAAETKFREDMRSNLSDLEKYIDQEVS